MMSNKYYIPSNAIYYGRAYWLIEYRYIYNDEYINIKCWYANIMFHTEFYSNLRISPKMTQFINILQRARTNIRVTELRQYQKYARNFAKTVRRCKSNLIYYDNVYFYISKL
jgi:hypothetical protein